MDARIGKAVREFTEGLEELRERSKKIDQEEENNG